MASWDQYPGFGIAANPIFDAIGVQFQMPVFDDRLTLFNAQGSVNGAAMAQPLSK